MPAAKKPRTRSAHKQSAAPKKRRLPKITPTAAATSHTSHTAPANEYPANQTKLRPLANIEPINASFDRPAKKYLPKPVKYKKPRKPLHIKAHLLRWRTSIILGMCLVGLCAFALSPLSAPLWSSFIRHSVTIQVVDSDYGLPVPNVAGSLNGEAGQPETQTGILQFSGLPSGNHTILISREGYYPATVKLRLGPLSGSETRQVVLQPTGRQVIIKALDSLSGQPVAGATLTTVSATNTTNQSGQASIAAPSDATALCVAISAANYTSVTTDLSLADNNPFTIQLVPAGQAYYFDRNGATADLYGITLDASTKTVILPGVTANSVPPQLARSPDLRWLAFTGNRDGSRDGSGAYLHKLYLMDTASHSLVPMNDDYARYKIVGWTKANQLIYTVERVTTDFQPAGKYQIRRYNPATGSDTAIFSNRSNPTNTNKNYKRDQEGYVGIYEQLYADPLIMNDYIVYIFRREAKPGYGHLLPPRSYIVIADLYGATLRTVRQNTGGYLYPKDMGNGRISYIDYSSGEKYYELEVATGVESQLPKNTSEPIRTVASPDGSHIAWVESANSTNTIKVARANGQDVRTVAIGFALTIQAWYGNNYLLLDSADTAFSISVTSIYGGPPLRLTEFTK